MVGSGMTVPLACGTPAAIRAVRSVPALPMSIWPTAMSNGLPSRAHDFVSPVIACLVAVYGAELGRGAWAEIDFNSPLARRLAKDWSWLGIA